MRIIIHIDGCIIAHFTQRQAARWGSNVHILPNYGKTWQLSFVDLYHHHHHHHMIIEINDHH